MSDRWGLSRGAPRYQRRAEARRARARAHLERVRGGRRGPTQPRPGRRLTVACAIGSILAGAVLGRPLVAWATRQLADETGIQVSVRGAARLSPAEIASAAGLAPGARVEPATAEAQLASHPWIREARAVELATGRLLVEVTERVPVALLEGEEPRFVDATGTAFAPATAEAAGDPPAADLVRLAVAEPGEPGAADPRLAEAIAIADRLPALGLARPERIAIAAASDPTGYALELPGWRARVVLGRDDVAARLDALAELLAAGVPEAARAETLDLRFADQVVLREPPPSKGAAQAAPARGRAPASEAPPTG